MSKLALWGQRGEVVMPDHVVVTLTVPEASASVVRGFIGDPRFDREIGAGLANRVDVPVDDLPVREYAVDAGDEVAIAIRESAPRPWQLVIEGGDRDGTSLMLPPSPPD